MNLYIAARQVVVIFVRDGFDGQSLIVFNILAQGDLERSTFAELVDFVIHQLLQPRVCGRACSLRDKVLLNLVGQFLPVEINRIK